MAAADAARWDRFVLRCPQATFFHRAGWQRVIEQGFGHRSWFLYAELDGQIVGVLPLAQIRSRLFGNSLSSLPFCVYGGIASAHPAAAAALDQAARTLAGELGVDYLEYRALRPDSAEQSASPLYCTFRKPLLATPEQNLLAIPRKQRAMVRKAQGNGLRSVVEPDSTRLYDCYARSVHRLGTPMFERRYFELLRSVFGADCEILAIEHQRQAVSAVLLFYFRDEVLPYYGGGAGPARALAANDFMYWEVMRQACERGYTLFDFGRSKIGTGAYDFKKNWGFEAQPLYYRSTLFRGARLPDKNPLNPRYRWLIRAWQRLPLPLANALGPHLVRQLG